mgnify:CR=1 FL=1
METYSTVPASDTAQKCMVCDQYIQHGQLISGIRVTPDVDEVIGHYGCIVTMLGPERYLQALMAHELPMIDVTTLSNGRVPGWEKLFDVSG